MDRVRIAELLQPFLEASPHPSRLSTHQLDQISTYIDLLLRWNARINLTAIRTPEQIVTRHFGESLFAAWHLLPSLTANSVTQEANSCCGKADGPTPAGAEPQEPSDALSAQPKPARHSLLVDLGSGAGFPGLPAKIWSPKTPVTLIESNQKKVAFLREVIRALTLTDIDVYPARAETFSSRATLVTLRAVEQFETILPVATALLAPNATLALLIGASQVAKAKSLAPHLSWHAPITIPDSEARIILTAQAILPEPGEATSGLKT